MLFSNESADQKSATRKPPLSESRKRSGSNKKKEAEKKKKSKHKKKKKSVTPPSSSSDDSSIRSPSSSSSSSSKSRSRKSQKSKKKQSSRSSKKSISPVKSSKSSESKRSVTSSGSNPSNQKSSPPKSYSNSHQITLTSQAGGKSHQGSSKFDQFSKLPPQVFQQQEQQPVQQDYQHLKQSARTAFEPDPLISRSGGQNPRLYNPHMPLLPPVQPMVGGLTRVPSYREILDQQNKELKEERKMALSGQRMKESEGTAEVDFRKDDLSRPDSTPAKPVAPTQKINISRFIGKVPAAKSTININKFVKSKK